MKFGKVTQEELENIDFSLPDPTFYPLPNPRTFKVYLGCPAWSCPEWKGKIYPSTAKTKDFLLHYSHSFNTIELNATHYGIPSEKQIENWYSKVSNEFRFCPKVPQSLSHASNLQEAKQIMDIFLSRTQKFADTLGPAFIQFPEEFSPLRKEELISFLKNSVPEGTRLALEFRHKDWFKEEELKSIGDFLHKRNLGLLITDVSGRRDVLHNHITAPYILIRFVGNSLHPSDEFRLDQWAETLSKYRENGVEEVYFFVHQPEETECPETSELASSLFEKKLQEKIIKPKFQQKAIQKTLF